MRETKFIEQNKAKWEELEQLMESPDQDPEKLNEYFVQITDDLAHARTFYPNRSVRVYLNSLAQRIFTSIYRGKKTDRNRLFNFWKEELPQIVYESRKEFWLSLAIFSIAMLIGVVSSMNDGEFVRHILGDSYVEMTLENIESGDPMAVYKSKGELGMSLGIAANNIWVAFLTFIMGVFYAIGTVWILIKNGIMVGAFQYFFVQEGVFWESFLGIWTHGTLEISAIVIAGAAGLTMGRGLVFPGTFSRLKAFQLSARRGLKIMIGITPIFLLAGFIEGYLTRQTETPDIIRLLFILSCLAFVVGYFILYPWLKAKRGFNSDLLKTAITPDSVRAINFRELKPVGQLFSETFWVYKKYIKTIFIAALASTALWCGILFQFGDGSPSDLVIAASDGSGFFRIFEVISSYFKNANFTLLPLLNGITFGIVAVWALQRVAQEANEEQRYHWLVNLSKMVVCCTALAVIMAAPAGLRFILLITAFPIIIVWMYCMIGENLNLFNSLNRSLGLVGTSFWNMMALFMILLIIGALFVMLLDTLVMNIILQAIGLNFNLTDQSLVNFYTILATFFSMLWVKMVFAMLLIGFGLQHYNLKEIRDAENLLERVGNIGSGKKIRGMELEG